MRPSSSWRPVALRTRDQPVRAPRADPVRAFGAQGGANGRDQRLPLSGDAAHAFAPRALRDPDDIVADDAAIRRGASCRNPVGRTRMDIGSRGDRLESSGIETGVGEWTDVVSGRPRG